MRFRAIVNAWRRVARHCENGMSKMADRFPSSDDAAQTACMPTLFGYRMTASH